MSLYASAAPFPMQWTQLPYRRDFFNGRRPWRTFDEDQGEDMAGLGKFLKKIHRKVRKVAVAPIRLVSKKLANKIEKADEKVIKAVDKVHDRISKFARKNMKWIIVAAAIAITIYSMGSGAGIAAKMMSGLAKLKTLAVAKASSFSAWGAAKTTAAKAAFSKLLAGKKFGELNQQEVSALAETNQAAGESLVPAEVMGLLRPTTETLPVTDQAMAFNAQTMAMPDAYGQPEPSSLPSWVMPAGLAAAALLAVVVMNK